VLVTVPIALFGWLLVVPALFLILPGRRAALIGVIGGVLFLPMAAYHVQGIPEFSKLSSIGYGLAIGIALTSLSRFASTRPSWLDLWMCGWLLVVPLSILANGMEVKFALSSLLSTALVYLMPYLAGRMFVVREQDSVELASAIVIGGLCYVPLCWMEMRLSPQLHAWVYGFHQHEFAQTWRSGGWRPMVFMQHGLMVAGWMMSATLMAAWLVAAKVRQVGRISTVYAFVVLVATLMLMRSLGALALFGVGIGFLAAVRALRMPALIAVLAIVPAGYLFARVGLKWDALQIVEISQAISPERASSLLFRIRNETLLIERALERPMLGWGGYGLNQLQGEDGSDITITDSLWIAMLGVRGLVGMICLYGWFLSPAIVVAWRCRRRDLKPSIRWVLLGLCSVSLFFAFDTLFNAMINQVYFMLSGALVSLAKALEGRARPGPRRDESRRAVVPGARTVDSLGSAACT
jgi:hypothetical protein